MKGTKYGSPKMGSGEIDHIRIDPMSKLSVDDLESDRSLITHNGQVKPVMVDMMKFRDSIRTALLKSLSKQQKKALHEK